MSATELTLTLIYDDKPPIQAPGAERTLEAARSGLRLLRATEKALTGKRPALRWKVNIYSLADRAVIEFSTHGDYKISQAVGERALGGVSEVFGEVPE